MVKSAKEAREKWEERIRASAKWYKHGVENPTKDWAEEAIKAKDKRNAGLQRAIQEGRIEKGIARVGTAKWQKNTIEKGISRWTTDAPKAGSDYENAMGATLECIEYARKVIENMPATTVEERAERSKAYQLAMSECMKKKKGY